MSEMTPERVARALASGVVFADLPEDDSDQERQEYSEDDGD